MNIINGPLEGVQDKPSYYFNLGQKWMRRMGGFYKARKNNPI